jgi:hypothetical protein
VRVVRVGVIGGCGKVVEVAVSELDGVAGVVSVGVVTSVAEMY